MKKLMKKQKGITLIALVVTIIVLLILAAVSIQMLTGESSIVIKANEAQFKTDISSIKEEIQLKEIDSLTEATLLEKRDVFSLRDQIEKQIQSLKIGIRNCDDAISTIQIAEEQLNEVYMMIQRMNELIVHCVNLEPTSADMEAIAQEISQIIEEMNKIADSTTFASLKLLDGSFNEKIEFGNGEFEQGNIQISIENLHFDKIYGASEIDYNDLEKAIENLEKANIKVSSIRSQLAAFQNCLDYENEYLNNMFDNMQDLATTTFGDITNGYLEEEQMVKNVKSWKTTNKILQISQVTLNSIQSQMERIQELIIICENETNDDSTRKSMQLEINALLNIIGKQLTYSGVGDLKLFNGTFPDIEKVTLDILEIKDISVMSVEESKNSTIKIDKAISAISSVRESIGNYQNELDSKLDQEADSGYTFEIGKTKQIAIPEKYKDKLQIIDGKLTYIGNDKKERQWAIEIGIDVLN